MAFSLEGLGIYNNLGTSYITYGPLKEADWAFCVGIYGREFQKYTKETLDESGRVRIALLLIFTLFLGSVIVFMLSGLFRQRKYNLQLLRQKEEIQAQALSIAVSEERFRIAMERTGDIILEYQMDVGKLVSFYSGNCVEYEGTADILLKEQLLNGIEMDEQSFIYFQEAFQILHKGISGTESILHTADGKKWYQMSVSVIRDIDGKNQRAIAVIKDVTKEQGAELDSLTGFFNKAAMTKLVREAVETNEPDRTGAFCMLDIDYFKKVNDTYGHPVGDMVLLKISQILRDVFPKSYQLGRFGGDEFCILCRKEATKESLQEYLESACEQIRMISFADVLAEADNPGYKRNQKIGVSCSCGIALYAGKAAFEAVYRLADETLYEVKTAGKGGYRFAEINLKIFPVTAVMQATGIFIFD